ncbi:MAG TPA: TetR/AcrR family transcriptional regulator [Aggregatilinea sp.]|jgi:AcrR family transcriptional regulator|uniref:TetR/AcrR family transcriptional regulator n=1 Tax=Aggregatilinea sp. TaxID=2806333 RepID=UPI002B6178BD|nr:TetR/AcrR family transcriptional regulator [Aggregatilinea sp.]HML22735.1 TetR/AcrR family transcriptional regulator [Aggregatilinea sp.]
MPRGRYQQKQWEVREQAILDALETLSAERGFNTVTMDDLAASVGISKATLYQHFPSKDEMVSRLLAQHEDRFLSWLDDISGEPVLARLSRIMRYLLEGHVKPLQGPPGVEIENIMAVFERDPDLIARHDDILKRLAAIIEQGQSDGAITPLLTPDAIIAAMFALSKLSDGIGSGHASIDQIVLLFERAVRAP